MKQRIIGRKDEMQRLTRWMQSDRSEFIAIYGRRRVGKTFLVNELLEGQMAFRVSGMEKCTTSKQLGNFAYALQDFTGEGVALANWGEAFRALQSYLNRLPSGPKIVFFDELPWFDTPRSGFLAELEHFWNSWASYRRDIKFIACGSATTWMLSKLLNSRGGLHNRVTHEIALAPFTLAETEAYFASQHFNYSRHEVLGAQMAVGGVAYYLSLFEPDQSVAQNIERLCFTRGGALTSEFDRLYRALFKKADDYMLIVTALSHKNQGMTRLDLLQATKLPNNGNFTTKLRELEQCDFIRSYQPFGKSKKEQMYQLVDPFTLFYFKFMHGHSNFLPGYWVKMHTTAAYHTWSGYAFEIVCLNHIPQIVKALGIDGSINVPCSWSYRPPKDAASGDDDDLKHGAQIDLLIDRSDNTITVCEMKYSDQEYEITKDYYSTVQRRLRTFRKVTHTSKSLVPAFVTAQGLVDDTYARQLPRNVTADDLFA